MNENTFQSWFKLCRSLLLPKLVLQHPALTAPIKTKRFSEMAYWLIQIKVFLYIHQGIMDLFEVHCKLKSHFYQNHPILSCDWRIVFINQNIYQHTRFLSDGQSLLYLTVSVCLLVGLSFGPSKKLTSPRVLGSCDELEWHNHFLS